MRKFIGLLLIFIACEQRSKPVTSPTVSDTLAIEQPEFVEIQKLPAQFLADQGIDSWENLNDLQESVEKLSTLNQESISIYLINLRGLTQKMNQNEFPDPFNISPIKSRLKVIQMQADKCLYFTRHYKKDSLSMSLVQLYNHYNAFVARIISASEETQALPQSSTTEEER